MTSSMRVVLLIENLESGGAQRQIVMLALGLASEGVDVEVIVYYPQDFFLPQLQAANVPVTFITGHGLVGRVLAIRRAIRSRNPDVVVAYLGTPAVVAELGSLPSRKYALVVSERTGRAAAPSMRDRLTFQMHRFADVVVSNSNALRAYIGHHAPWLRHKLRVILNCVDLDTFHPADPSCRPDAGRIAVVGRVRGEKNALGVVRALGQLMNRDANHPIRVDWFGSNYYQDGKPTPTSEYFAAVLREIEQRGLETFFQFRGETRDVVKVYQQADAVCLPSIYESFPNALAEAAACGRPLLASDVGDNGVLVVPGRNGFLFDPNSPESIAAAFWEFSQLSAEQKAEMGRQSRKLAEEILGRSRFMREYRELFASLRP